MQKSLKLHSLIGADNLSQSAGIEELTTGLTRTIGNVTFAVLQRSKQAVRYVLVHKIEVKSREGFEPTRVRHEIAERLAKLEIVTTLFTLDIYQDAAIIPRFTRAASLGDIFGVQMYKPFDRRHIQIVGTDIMAGLQSLQKVGLQRGSFSEQDILLVDRQYTYGFQIGKTSADLSKAPLTVEAGLEKCEKARVNSPTNKDDLQSLAKILSLLEKQLQRQPPHLINTPRSSLRNWGDIGSIEHNIVSPRPSDWDPIRNELDIYLEVVHIFGTPVGGILGPNE